MHRVQGWNEHRIREREWVFEALVAKATRLTARRIALNLNAALTAAVTVSLEPTEPVNGWQPSGGAMAATWNAAVDAELLPYVVDSFVDSAADVHRDLALAGVAAPKITYDLASDYLAAARNRLQGVGDLIWNGIRVQLSEGYAAGESTLQLAARVRDVVKISGPKANTIARTEVVAAVNAASLLQVKLAGFDDQECRKTWIATEDERTRPAHHLADGQVVALSKPFIVGGEGLQFPGDPIGRPDNVINCRCTLGYVFSDDDDDDDDDDEPFTADAMPVEARWVEELHPRDVVGKFADKFDWITADDAWDMHDKMIMYEPWTSANETALGAYAHDSYAAINMHLRGEDDEPVDLTLRQIDDIHDAMRPTTRPLRVQRGLYADAFPGAATAGDIGDMVGKVFEDRGFLSTTIDPSYQRPGGRTNKIVYLELHVPEGTPAAYLGFPDGPGLEAERELLLDRGTRFVITGTDESSDGSRFVVTGRVLPRDEPLTAASAYGRKAAHLVKSATKKWKESLHPRDPNTGEFIDKGVSIGHILPSDIAISGKWAYGPGAANQPIAEIMMYSDNHADILTPDSQVISKNVPASDIKTHIAQYYNAKVSQPVNKKLPAAGWDPGDIWYEFKKIGPIEYGKLSPAEQAQIGQAAMYAHDRGFDAPLFYLDDLKAAQVGKGPLKTPIGVGLVPTGGQPLKINTKTVFKTKYTHGTIVAVKLDHDPPLRITWSESNYEKPKFIIQSRHPDGAWAPISFGLMQKLGIEGNSLGKGQLYEAFKDDPGWKTPGGAPPAPTVPVVSTVKKSKIPQHDSSKTAINKYFTDLTIAKWNTLSNGERIELENLAIDQQTVGNNTPSGVLALINTFKNAQPTPVVTEMTEMPITHMTPKEIKKLPNADFLAVAKHITDSEWKTLSFDQQVAIVNHDGDTGLGGNTSATPNLTALINKNGMNSEASQAAAIGLKTKTDMTPKTGVLSPPTGKFELLDDTGVSGDGYAPGGQWGKFGAAGVLIQWDSSFAEPRYLLVQRGPGVSSNQGKWQLPGGALNGSENAYQAAARETVEEVGAPKSYLTKLQPVGEHVYTHEPTGWQYTTIAARSSTPFMPKVDGTETSNAAWFTAAEIDKMLTQGQIVPKLDTALKPIIDAYPQVTRAGGGTGDTGFFVPKNLNSYDDEDLDGFYETISQADWDGLDSGSKSYLTKIANQAEANGDTDLPKFTIENLKTGTGPNANETFMPTLDQLIVPVDQMTKQQFVEWLDAQTPLSYEQLTPKEKQLVTATVADNDVQELFNYATSKPSGAKVNIIDVKRSDLESTGQTVGTHGAQIYQSKFTGDRYLFKPTPDKLDYTIEVDVAVNRLQKKLGIEAPPLRAFNVDGTPGTLQEMLPYPTASFNAKDLTPTQVNDLVAHQAFDWLISQHDTAPSNILQLPNGKFMPIDKTQAFKYFPFDKLDNDFTPNPEKTVYQRMWTAFEKGQIDVPSPTDGATGAGMALWNMQHMSDADFHAILRPYAEAAAKRGALMNPNVPAYGPLAKPPITYQQNDVDNFLALITERKNNLLADFQEFYDAEVKKRKANGFSTGVKLAPTPAVATPSKSVTPAFVPLPAPPASTTAQVLGGGTPLKISSKLIHVTKHANLSVVAERVTPAGQHHRLIWDEYGKKYVHQAQNDNAAWLQLSTYSKAGAYEQFKNQTDWKVPGTLTMGPPPAHDIGAAVTLSPVKPKLPQFSAASIQAQHGGIGDFTTGHKDKIYTKFKHGTTMGGVTSTAAGPKAFKALALTVAEINANPQFAGQKVNLLQALKIIDEHKVTKHGGVNSNAYEKKIVEWLGTPAGKKSAAGLIAWAEEVAQAKTAGTPLPASPLGTAVNIAPASSIGTPATTSSLSFPVVSPTEAAAMHSKVMATKVWSSQQRSTIKNYTGGGFDPINKALRFGGGSPTTVQKAKLIQSAMYPAQRSFIVHRGTNDIGVPNLKTFADVQALLGKSFEEKGFSSGSVGGHAAFSGKTFLLEIEVPQGTPGAFIRSASQYPHENEYLLAAGTKFKVLKVTDNGGSWPGKYIIRVRVIP